VGIGWGVGLLDVDARPRRKRLALPITIVLVVALLGGGSWWWYQQCAPAL
jgi:multidrug resistance efflux pump